MELESMDPVIGARRPVLPDRLKSKRASMRLLPNVDLTRTEVEIDIRIAVLPPGHSPMGPNGRCCRRQMLSDSAVIATVARIVLGGFPVSRSRHTP